MTKVDERIRLVVSGVTVLSGEIVLGKKTLLVGPNGSGKTSILNSIAMAISGCGLRGIRPALLAPQGKSPMVSLFIDGDLAGEYPNGTGISDWRILDLSNMGTSGPDRTAFLLELLHGTLTHVELIEALVRDRTDKDIMEEIRAMGTDVSTVVAGINEKKKLSDSASKTNAARVAVKTTRSRDVIEAELHSVVEQINSPEASEATIREQLAGMVAEHPTLASIKIPSAVSQLTANIKKGMDKIAELKETDKTISDVIARTRQVAALKSADCPLCGTTLSPEKVDEMKSAYATAVADRDETAKIVNQWVKYVRDAQDKLNIIEKYTDLKKRAKGSPDVTVDMAALRAKQRELTTELSSADAISKQGALDIAASAWRTAENVIKKAKTMKAEAAKFPDQVAAIVKDVMGAKDLTFSKVGRTEDIVLVTEDGPRQVSTLSSGEFAVVAAAFAATDPHTIILVEAAEIDTDRLTKLMAHLKDMDQPTIVASWDNSRKAPGWTIKSCAIAER